MSGRPRTPLLIWAAAGFGLYFVGLSAIVWAVMIAIALLGNGPFTVYGHAATRWAFLLSMVPVFLSFAVIDALMLAFVIAVRRRRAWSRAVAVARAACLFATALISDLLQRAPADDLAATAVTVALLGAFVAWYFFRKRAVVAYYRGLNAPDTASVADAVGL